MHRLSNGTQTNTAPAAPAVSGTPGYPTQGDPATASIPSELDYFLDYTIQEEISHVIEASGVALDKTNPHQLLPAIQSLITAGTDFIRMFEFGGDFLGNGAAIPAGTVIPDGGHLVLVEMCAGGGAGGSGNGGGGGGGSGGSGVRGWLNTTPGAPVTGGAGNGGTTNAAGTGGVAATLSTLSIGGVLVANCGPGNNGALGGSALVAGNTAFGQVSAAMAGLTKVSGETGGDGLLLSDLMIGGDGGASLFGPGGKVRNTPVAAGAAAPGHASTFYGGGGSGATGSGVGAPGAPGIIRMWVFG